MSGKQQHDDMLPAIYTPQEASNYALEQVESVRAKKLRSAKIAIPGISSYYAPQLPGQLAVVLAQTSNYKSSFLHAWERDLAMQLNREERFDEAIIHVSVEEVVEEQINLQLANITGEKAGDLARGTYQNWDKLQEAAVRVAQIPIYRIGDSLARADQFRDLHLRNIFNAILDMTNGKVTGQPIKPAAIFYDYLQAFPEDPKLKSKDRYLQIKDDVYRLRQSSVYFDCPVIVACQAKQDVTGRKGVYVPGMYDPKESSYIAERCDRLISLWLPCRIHYNIGETFKIGNNTMTVKEDMLIIKVTKQRGGLPAGQMWICKVDFDRNIIKPDPEYHADIMPNII